MQKLSNGQTPLKVIYLPIRVRQYLLLPELVVFNAFIQYNESRIIVQIPVLWFINNVCYVLLDTKTLIH